MPNPIGSFSTITLPSGDKYIILGVPYAVCATAASTQQKEITVDGITSLDEGLSIRVNFVNAQSYNGVPTLQVNSLTAANIMKRNGESAGQYEWKAGDVLDLVYDGTYWVIVNSDNVATMAETMSYLGISSS